MGKHTDHTKPIDGLDSAPGNPIAKHRREGDPDAAERAAYAEATGYVMRDGMAHAKCVVEPYLAPLSATGHASLAAEYRGMGIDPALAAIVEEHS